MLRRLVVVALVAPLFAFAAVVKLDDTDARFIWLPSVMNNGSACTSNPSDNLCNNVWWQESATESEGGTYHNTWGNSTQMSFKFTGREFTLFGTRSSVSAVGMILVNGIQTRRFNTEKLDNTVTAHRQELVRMNFTDATVERTITVAYDADQTALLQKDATLRYFIGIDYVEIDELEDNNPDDTSTATNTGSDLPTPTDTSTKPSDSASNSESHSSTTTSGGGGVSGLPTGSQPGGGSTPTSKPNGNNNGNSTDPNNNEKPGGTSDAVKKGLAVAGGVVGAIVLLAILWALFKRYRRRVQLDAELAEMMQTKTRGAGGNEMHPFSPYRDDEAPDAVRSPAGAAAFTRDASPFVPRPVPTQPVTFTSSYPPTQPTYPPAPTQVAFAAPTQLARADSARPLLAPSQTDLTQSTASSLSAPSNGVIVPLARDPAKRVLQAEEAEAAASSGSVVPVGGRQSPSVSVAPPAYSPRLGND